MQRVKFWAAAVLLCALAGGAAGYDDTAQKGANGAEKAASKAAQTATGVAKSADNKASPDASQISSAQEELAKDAADAAATAADADADASDSTAKQPANPYDFALLAEDGRTKTLADFAGSKLVIYFGYTLCADVCPTSLGIAGDALAELGATGVRLLFITLDPDRDKAADLGEYARYFWPAAEGLVPSHAELARLAKTYGVKFAYIKQESAADYTVAHSSSFYLIDERGKFAGEVSNLARKNVLKKFAKFLRSN